MIPAGGVEPPTDPTGRKISKTTKIVGPIVFVGWALACALGAHAVIYNDKDSRK
jgi:hypothetical protein